MRKAFTLIELLVVISIIALLMAVLMPALGMAREQGKRAVCASNQRSTATGIMAYQASNNGKLPPIKSLDLGQGYWTGQGQPGWTYIPMLVDPAKEYGADDRIVSKRGLGYLFTENFVEDARAFYCPSAPKNIDNITGTLTNVTSFQYSNYCNGDANQWPSTANDKSWTVATGMLYMPQSSVRKTKLGNDFYPDLAEKYEELDSSKLMLVDILHSLSHLPHKVKGKGKGVNATFGDSSVRFVGNSEAFSESAWDIGNGSTEIMLQQHEKTFRDVIKLIEQP